MPLANLLLGTVKASGLSPAATPSRTRLFNSRSFPVAEQLEGFLERVEFGAVEGFGCPEAILLRMGWIEMKARYPTLRNWNRRWMCASAA